MFPIQSPDGHTALDFHISEFRITLVEDHSAIMHTMMQNPHSVSLSYALFSSYRVTFITDIYWLYTIYI